MLRADRSTLFLLVGLVVVLAAVFGVSWWRWRQINRRNPTDHNRYIFWDVLAVGGLLALTVGFFWQALFERNVWMPIGGGDLASYYYPKYVMAGRAFASGDFPLWNPALYSGMPGLGDPQNALLYPLNLPLFLASNPVSYWQTEMLLVIHYWLAASFTYAFVRNIGLSRWAGVLAGIIFAFSSFMVTHFGHPPMIETATWLPLVLLTVNQAAKKRSLAWAISTGLVLAVAFLAGHFQLWVYVVYAAVALWLLVAWKNRPVGDISRRTGLRFGLGHIGLAAIIGFVVLGAVLVQLWPFWELGNASLRAAISYSKSTEFGVAPIGLAELFLPTLFTVNPQNYYGPWSSTEVMGYMALFTYGLGAFGLLLKRNYYAVFFAVLAGVGLLFSLSDFTILQGWLFEFVPALRLMRASGRFLVWFNLGGAVVAAFGLQAVVEYLRDKPLAEPVNLQAESLFKYGWRAVGIAVLLILLIPLPLLYNGIFTKPFDPNELLIRAINGVMFGVILLALAAVLLRQYWRRTLSVQWAASLTLALIVFDLFSARANFNPTTKDVLTGFQAQAVVNFLKTQDPTGQYRIDSNTGSIIEVWQPDSANLHGLHDLQGLVQPLQLSRYTALWNEIFGKGKNFRDLPAYNMLNAKYILSRSKEEPGGSQFKIVFQDKTPGININVSENANVLGRGWLVHKAVVQADEPTLKALGQSDFKPTELVYLKSGQAIDTGNANRASESVRLVSQSNNRLKFEVKADSQAYLVVSQAYYDGWKATVNSQATAYQTANYALGAVLVPAGTSTVELEFAPASWGIGLTISSLTWLGSIAAIVALNILNRRRGKLTTEIQRPGEDFQREDANTQSSAKIFKSS